MTDDGRHCILADSTVPAGGRTDVETSVAKLRGV